MRIRNFTGVKIRSPRINAFMITQQTARQDAANRAAQALRDLNRSIADGSYLAACQEQSEKNRKNFDAMMAKINNK